MDIQELVTRLTFRANFTKLNEYNKKIAQAARKAQALADKMASKMGKASDKVFNSEKKNTDKTLRMKEKAYSLAARAREKAAAQENRSAEKTYNYELKLRERLARMQEKMAEKSRRLAEKTAQMEQRAKERAFERAARIREKEANKENRLREKTLNYEYRLREKLARIKERMAAKELRDQEKAALKAQKIAEKALNYELKLRERMARMKEKLQQKEIRDREKAAAKQEKDVERGAAGLFMTGGLLTRFLGRSAKGFGKVSGELGAELNIIQALAELDDSGRNEIEKLMEQLVQENKLNPLETLEGISELARAGFKKEGLLQVTPAALDFATGTGDKRVTFEKASTLLTDMMFTFGMKLGDAGKISDILVTAMNESKLNFDDFSYALKYSAASADTVGMTLEQISALVAIEAQKGLRGSVAGTGLRKIITNSSLLGKDKGFRRRQKQTLDALGIEAFDPVTDNMDLLKVFGQLGKKLKGKKKAEQINTFNNLFGLTAQGQAMAILKVLDKPEFINMVNEIQYGFAGKTKQIKAIINKGYTFDVNKMMNNLTLLEKKLGDSVIPVLYKFVNGITKFAQALTNADPAVHKFIGGMLLLGTAITGVVTAAAGFTLLKVGFGLMAPAMAGSLAVMGEMLIVVGLLAIGILAVIDAIETLKGKDTVFKKISDDLNKIAKKEYGVDIPKIFDNIVLAVNSLTGALDALDKKFHVLDKLVWFYRMINNPEILLPKIGGFLNNVTGQLQQPDYGFYAPTNRPSINNSSMRSSHNTQIINGGVSTHVSVPGTNATPSQVAGASKQGTVQGVNQAFRGLSMNVPTGY